MKSRTKIQYFTSLSLVASVTHTPPSLATDTSCGMNPPTEWMNTTLGSNTDNASSLLPQLM